MLCAQCKETVLNANTPWGFHHKLKVLKESASTGCLICAQLEEDIQKAGLNFDTKTVTHRWTIRMNTHTRDQDSRCIAITLRAAGPQSFQPTLPMRVFHLINEKEIQNIPKPDQLTESTKASVGQLEKWIKECNADHPRCQRARDTRIAEERFIPTRLIELIEGGRLRLVETSEWSDQQKSSPYLTLSHCWGDPKVFTMFCTYPSNVKAFLQVGIELAELPKTFENVMNLARNLGISYVWIDSICVIQGKFGDFNIEAHHMHSVYRHSYLNVAAAASDNGDGGLYHSRFPHQIISPSFSLEKSILLDNESWRIFPGDLWDRQLLNETLYARGWVFQERMLSPRLVHFGSKQTFWDCATKSACEVFPNRIPEPLDLISATERHWRERLQLSSMIRNGQDLVGEADDSVETLWRMAIKSYTSCSLTKSEDKLIACWSIAKVVRDMLENDKYAVGMWSVNLHKQLAWKVLDYSRSRRIYKVKGSEVPTWTWASIDEKEKKRGCPVLLPQRLGNANAYSITGHDGSLLSFRLKVETDDLKARNEEPVLADLKLAIRGHVFVAFLRRMSSGHTLDLVDGTQNQDKIAVFPDLEPTRADKDHGVKFYTDTHNNTHSGRDFGLVTEATDENGQHNGSGLILECIISDSQPIFRRTGAFTFRGLNKDEWHHLNSTDGAFMKTSKDEINQQGLRLWLT